MRNLSNEELIEMAFSEFYSDKYKDEILRRFAAYEQTLAEIRVLADRMLEGT